MKTREKIADAIKSGDLLCEGCPAKDKKEGYYAGDIEVSKACWLCGVVEGKAMGTIDQLIDEIGEENLAYIIQ